MVEPPLGTPFQIMKKVKMAYCQFQDTDDVEEKIILFFLVEKWNGLGTQESAKM